MGVLQPLAVAIINLLPFFKLKDEGEYYLDSWQEKTCPNL
jgi:hypothetical protein